jgi:hypothetical protein
MDKSVNKWKGLVIALTIIIFWVLHLFYSLIYINIDFSSIFLYLHIAIQAYFTLVYLLLHMMQCIK